MVDLEDDYDDYEGSIRCFACSTTLEIRTEEGKVKTVKLMKNVLPSSVEGAFGVSPNR
jgi:hypothetical protein